MLLKSLKTEIEHTQHLLEVAKLNLQKDFEAWWRKQSAVTPHHPATASPPVPRPHHPATTSPPVPRPHHPATASPPVPRPHHPATTSPPVPRPHHPATASPPVPRPASSHRVKLKQAGMIAAQFSHHVTSPSAAGNGLGTTNQSLSTSQGLGTSTLPSGRASACHSDTDQLSRSSSSINASSVPLPSLPGRCVDTVCCSSNVIDVFGPFCRSVPLTGDTKADADILAFYRARQKLIQRSAHLPSSHH